MVVNLLEMDSVTMKLTIQNATMMVVIAVVLAHWLIIVQNAYVLMEFLTANLQTHWWEMVSAMMRQIPQNATMMDLNAVNLIPILSAQ